LEGTSFGTNLMFCILK